MRLICSKCDCNRLRTGDRRDFTRWKGQKPLLGCRCHKSERATGSMQTTSSPKVSHFLVCQQSALSDIEFCIPFSVSSRIRTFLIVPCRSFVSIVEDPVMAAPAGYASRKLQDSCQPYPTPTTYPRGSAFAHFLKLELTAIWIRVSTYVPESVDQINI
jgi:hypothetical protein